MKVMIETAPFDAAGAKKSVKRVTEKSGKRGL
jgi:hypothetical protein